MRHVGSAVSVLKEYQHDFESVDLERDDDGVLTATLHTNGGSLVWGTTIHRELPEALARIGSDRETKVVILTGAGDAFCARADESLMQLGSTPGGWDRISWEAKRMLENLLALEVPVVGAVNGPARIHAELVALSDIVLASETAYFQDLPHLPFGVVPGDGVHVVWPALLGPNRGRYFLLTGEKIDASEAHRLNIVGEVLAPDALMGRARELAGQLAKKPVLTLRSARVLLTQRLKRMILDDLGAGLSLEGLTLMDARARDSGGMVEKV